MIVTSITNNSICNNRVCKDLNYIIYFKYNKKCYFIDKYLKPRKDLNSVENC